jgi:hypothetical protein
VQADAQRDARPPRDDGHRAAAADGAARAVERRDEPRVTELDRAPAVHPDLPGERPLQVVGAGGGRVSPHRQHRRQHARRARLLARLREESLDARQHLVLIANEREVVVAGQLDELGARDVRRQVAPLFHVERAIARSMQHEGRHANRRQHPTDVDRRVHPRQRDGRARAGAHPQVRRPPLAKGGIGGHRRRALVDADRTAPLLDDRAKERVARLRRAPPRVVRIEHAARVAADHDQRVGALGVRRREQRAERTTLGNADQGRAFRPGRLHHGAHVVQPLLECRQLGHRHGIRQSRAALVEQDEAPERGQPRQEPRERRLVPEVLEVGDPAHHEDQIDRARSDHLVGDVDAAALRVLDARRRGAGHRRDEAIAAPVRRLDEPRRVRVIVQRLANLADRHLEHRVAHEDARPERAEDLGLRDQRARPRREVLEQGKCLRRQRDRRVVAVQATAGRVEAEDVERQHQEILPKHDRMPRPGRIPARFPAPAWARR